MTRPPIDPVSDNDGGFWELWYQSGDVAYDLEEMLEKDPTCLPDRLKHDLKSMNAAGDDADPAAVLRVIRAARAMVRHWQEAGPHDDYHGDWCMLQDALTELDKEAS